MPNPYRVENNIELIIPGLLLRANPGLKLANAFGVKNSKFDDSARRTGQGGPGVDAKLHVSRDVY